MPDGGTRLGDRLRDWLEGLWESLGLQRWSDDRRQSSEEWEAIGNLDDLRRWVTRWGTGDTIAIGVKARELGASDNQVRGLVNAEMPLIYENPSEWIGQQMQEGFTSALWGEFSEIYGALIIDPFLATITGGKMSPNAPEIENIRRFLGSISTFEAMGSALSDLAEVASIGQLEDFGRMFTEAKWTLGTCFTSWQSTAPIVQAVILEPLQRLVNRTFTQANFTRTQWMDLFALGKIDRGRLRAELANLGFDSQKIEWLLSLADRQLSRGDIVSLWNKGIIGEVTAATKFREMGYGHQDVEYLMRMYRKEESSEEKGALLGTLRKAYKENLISEEEFRDALKRQGRSQEAIGLEVAVLQLSAEVEVKTAAKSDIRSAYMEDVIGKPEAEHWLREAGFASHDIKLLLDTWDQQKAPTYKQINKSEILKAWGLGVLTQPEAYQRLRNVGYPERDATVLMDTYAKANLQTKPPVGRTLKASDIMRAWHTEVIEENEVLTRLVELGHPEEDAEIIFETFQRLHPRITAEQPKELKKNDVLLAYGRGILSGDEAFDRLLKIGYDELDAGLLIDSYDARPEALPPEPTIAQLISATRRGVIDQAVLSQKLTVLGLPAESVQFYVSYATTPLPERTRSLSRTDIVKLWTQGRHDRAWAIDSLLALNYSPEDVEDILWLSRPEIADTETFILWKAGLIDDAIAGAMWTTMGFSAEQIAEYITVE